METARRKRELSHTSNVGLKYSNRNGFDTSLISSLHFSSRDDDQVTVNLNLAEWINTLIHNHFRRENPKRLRILLNNDRQPWKRKQPSGEVYIHVVNALTAEHHFTYCRPHHFTYLQDRPFYGCVYERRGDWVSRGHYLWFSVNFKRWLT